MQAPARLLLRRFSSDDAPFVARLGVRAFSEFSVMPGKSTPWMAAHHPSLVATLNGVSIGFAIVALFPGGGGSCLLAIAVESGFRGRGIGRRLLLAAEQLARERGATRMITHTADANLAALDLFLKQGYRIEKRHARYYRNTLTACELVKHW